MRGIAEIESPSLYESPSRALPSSQHPLATEERWLAVRRIVDSASFARSSRLSSFLLYVCEKTLLGCTDEITEQQIGVNVFGRSADYNPGDDNIVRGVARQLRQRLALYYQEEGVRDPWRVSIPRGGYVAVFEPTASAETRSEQLSADSPRTLPQDEIENVKPPVMVAAARPWQLPILCGVAFLVGVLGVLGWQKAIARKLPESPTSPLWNAMFTPERRTVLVAGDAGLNMFNNLARRKVTAAEYRTRSYLNSPLAESPAGYTWTPFVRRDYTSFPDLLLVSKIVRRPEVIPDRLDVRFARNVSMEDLKESNVILLGSENYDPWISMFSGSQNFALVWHGDTNVTEITNAAPHTGEQASYVAGKQSDSERRIGYALIALTTLKARGNKILMIQGTSMLGIDAAIDFIVQEKEFGAVLKKASANDGHLGNFEVLLQSDFVNGSTQNTHVLAIRLHP